MEWWGEKEPEAYTRHHHSPAYNGGTDCRVEGGPNGDDKPSDEACVTVDSGGESVASSGQAHWRAGRVLPRRPKGHMRRQTERRPL